MEGVQSGRSTRIAVSALFAAAAFAASALAATGELTPKGCIDDQPPEGPDNCTESAFGLDGAQSVAVSADGKFVYAASSFDDAIVRFKRSQATGALTPQGCVEDTAQDECDGESAGLDSARSVVVTADGKSVYAVSAGDDAIVHFKRNKTTGVLTAKGCIEDAGLGGCDEETAGLDSVRSVAVSADGKSVYAASFTDSAIVRFKRNRTNGALTPQGCIQDSGLSECDEEALGLDGVRSITVSADGRFVYAASDGDDAIVRFRRNETSGALTPKGCVEDTGQDECDEETAGLAGARSVVMSADGRSVYAASVSDDAIVRFKRNTTSGALTPRSCVEDTGQDECEEETAGLDQAASVTVSPDGRSVYATADVDDAIVRFKRNTTSGALTPKGCIEDSGQTECDEETAGLDEVGGLAVSPDGRFVYTASSSDDAIVRFKRER